MAESPFFEGRALYGDDLSGAGLEQWFAEEAEGYADLGAKDAAGYTYGYYALNRHHGFRHLPSRSWSRVLGFGSAYGHELTPIARHAASITIVDPSSAFVHSELEGTPLRFVKSVASGILPFPSEHFDLITCLGVLHHIANVSFVFAELARVLAPGGYWLLREPITSMGDWRFPRPGLTKNERGIPIDFLRRLIEQAGLRVLREAPCISRAIQRTALRLGLNPYSSQSITQVDAWFSAGTGFRAYHAFTPWQKIRPMAVYYVLQKPKVAAASSSAGP